VSGAANIGEEIVALKPSFLHAPDFFRFGSYAILHDLTGVLGRWGDRVFHLKYHMFFAPRLSEMAASKECVATAVWLTNRKALKLRKAFCQKRLAELLKASVA
jgi:hypothetical protein